MSPEALAGLSARRAARFPDARVAHFIDLEPRLGERLAPVLELPEEQLAWDVFLLYAPGAEWGEAPPKPAFWMHQLDRGPPEKRLEAARLAAEIEKLLASGLKPRSRVVVPNMSALKWRPHAVNRPASKAQRQKQIPRPPSRKAGGQRRNDVDIMKA